MHGRRPPWPNRTWRNSAAPSPTSRGQGGTGRPTPAHDSRSPRWRTCAESDGHGRGKPQRACRGGRRAWSGRRERGIGAARDSQGTGSRAPPRGSARREQVFAAVDRAIGELGRAVYAPARHDAFLWNSATSWTSQTETTVRDDCLRDQGRTDRYGRKLVQRAESSSPLLRTAIRHRSRDSHGCCCRSRPAGDPRKRCRSGPPRSPRARSRRWR